MLTWRWVLVFVVQEQTATQHKPALGIQCCLQSTSMLTANDNLLTFTASLSASSDAGSNEAGSACCGAG